VGFQLLFSGVVTVIEGLHIFLNVVSDCGCVKVFKLLVYLSAGAYTVVLLRALYTYNLLLSKVPSCLIVAAVYRVSIEFPFRLSRNFKGGRVGINN
jgi:hypothetical protein